MRKRILLAVSMLLILGLTFAAFAYNKQGETSKSAMDCCMKSDDCPMKKNAESAAKEDCCMKDDACPMKEKQAQTSGVDMRNVVVVGGESCCQPGADCCKSGSCCNGKHS